MKTYYGIHKIHIRSDLDKTDHSDGFWIRERRRKLAYRESGELNFSHALEALRKAQRMARRVHLHRAEHTDDERREISYGSTPGYPRKRTSWQIA